MQKTLSDKMLMLIAAILFFAGSYICYCIEKTGFELEYGIKEVSLKISADVIDNIRTVLSVLTAVSVAIIAAMYLKRVEVKLKWAIMVPVFLVLSVLANITFSNFEINPLTYYEQSRYFHFLLYILLEVVLFVIPFLMLFERFLVIKIIGGVLFLFLCWVMF